MVLAVVQSKANEGSATPVMTNVLPGAPTPGNLLLIWATAFQGYSSVSANFTYSGITVTDANNGVMRLYYRYVQPGDIAALAFGSCNTNFWNLSVIEVSGVTGVWATDFDQSDVGSSTGNITTSTITTVAANAFALLGVQCAGISTLAGTFSAPWTQTDIVNTGYTAGGGYRQMGGSGASVNATVTWTHSFTATYIMITLNTPGGAGALLADTRFFN